MVFEAWMEEVKAVLKKPPYDMTDEGVSEYIPALGISYWEDYWAEDWSLSDAAADGME